MSWTNTLGFLLLVVILAVPLQAQRGNRDDEGQDHEYQREQKRPGESEKPHQFDMDFNQMVGTDRPHPSRDPTRGDCRSSYRAQKDDLMDENPDFRNQMERDERDMTFNPSVNYYSSAQWLSTRDNQSCCPREWNYGCESHRIEMPCFLKAYGRNPNRVQWCCPYYPAPLTMKKCLCRRCHILKPKCMTDGRCHRRYREKQFYAICYSNSRWSQIRYLNMELPTSCYCKSSS